MPLTKYAVQNEQQVGCFPDTCQTPPPPHVLFGDGCCVAGGGAQAAGCLPFVQESCCGLSLWPRGPEPGESVGLTTMFVFEGKEARERTPTQVHSLNRLPCHHLSKQFRTDEEVSLHLYLCPGPALSSQALPGFRSGHDLALLF